MLPEGEATFAITNEGIDDYKDWSDYILFSMEIQSANSTASKFAPNMNQTLSQIQKDGNNGKKVPFKITDIEKVKSLRPFRSRSNMPRMSLGTQMALETLQNSEQAVSEYNNQSPI